MKDNLVQNSTQWLFRKADFMCTAKFYLNQNNYEKIFKIKKFGFRGPESVFLR